MIAVIFEVVPHHDHKATYLEIAAQLKMELETLPGFISVERFQSLTDQNKILSLSFFETEDAVRNWRNLESHRRAQSSGRSTIFENYRLRVAKVVRDYGKVEREQVPKDSSAYHLS